MKRMKFFWGLSMLTLLGLMFSCNQRHSTKPEKFNPEFANYISGYTANLISSNSAIIVRLKHVIEMPDKQAGDLLDMDLFEFSPKVKGKAYLEDKYTIRFEPDELLKPEETYDVKFALHKLFEVDKDLSWFEFSFTVIAQSFQVTTLDFKPYSNNDLHNYFVQGYITTADFMLETDAQKLLQASQGRKGLSIRWEFGDDPKKFSFIVDSISRTENVVPVVLSWDGNPLGLDITGTDTISIPALGDFIVVEVKLVQQPEQFVNILFSDPLSEDQNLDGLIRFQDNSKIKFDVKNNSVKVYPENRIAGNKTLLVEPGVKNILGFKMNTNFSIELSFEDIKPAVRLIGKGVILPQSDGLIFPFEAVNLNAVDIRIIKIFEDNIPQFLQVNQLDGSSEIMRVGKPVLKKKISLNVNPSLDGGKWNAYSVDLSELIGKDPAAIYQVELSFKQDYSLYRCSDTTQKNQNLNTVGEEANSVDELDDEPWDDGNYYSYYYYYPPGYDWRERDNPCHISYYHSGRWVRRNVIASNLGIIAKAGSGRMLKVAVTDLRTTNPLNNVVVELYNYQQQKIGQANTDNNGFADIEMDKKPWLLVARKGTDIGYLKLDDGSALSLSMFDVSGQVVQKGIKGFLYGERGVWRPGDTLFLNFILEDRENILPEDHPVSFELKNPEGQVISRLVKNRGLNGFYNFTTTTNDDAPTGLWIAIVKVGALEFYKTIRIETVKPNRLKIKLEYDDKILSVDTKGKPGKLNVKWLHGAIARKLKARVMVTLNSIRTKFEKYDGYVFDDATKIYYPEEVTIFDERINDLGEALVKSDLGVQHQAPGMLKANFMVRAFEESGDFSTDFFSVNYAPYHTFVGIKLPKTGTWGNAFVTDSTYSVEVATVDKDGNPVSVPKLEVSVYKMSWRWWWDVSYENLGNYVRRDYQDIVQEKTISTTNGKGSFNLKIEYPKWGRFLVRIVDPEGGHSSSQLFYADWPDWVSRDNREQPEGAKVMSFTTDKDNYEVGDKVTVTFPTSGQGRALVSIEDGSDMLDAYWVIPEPGSRETKFSFDITSEMTPNIYVYITYIQPHAQTANDLPIRLYGVKSIHVEDSETRILPVIDMPDELSPEKTFTVKVSEKNNIPMTYTLAIVDDGLLDLTRFQTPDPWTDFYAKEALGVKTWDIYDYVLGAYGGKLEQLFAIGGDAAELKNPTAKANRFKPVVKFLGPFELKKGTHEHTIQMPRYVGSVRTMVIAGQDGAYGFADKTIPVRNSLMLLGTLPRVLGPGETVKLPVTVFAMDEKVKKVKVEIQTNEFLIPVGEKTILLDFEKPGDEVITFDLKVPEKTGVGKVSIVAASGSEKATYDIEIQVRNPNPPITRTIETIIQPGDTWVSDCNPVGMEGTNSGLLEVSRIPPIDFGRRLKYLVGYPYGCAEQTTSSVFAQLYLDDVMELDPRMKTQITQNIKAAIQKLSTMQLSNGGFRYWPNAIQANDWISSYAGHFILEAETKGYTLPSGFKSRWIKYQKSAAKNWVYYSKDHRKYYHYYHLQQAYRLYTLALAGEPDLSSMNRFREMTSLSAIARWRLAAAYALAGKPEVAKELCKELDLQVDNFDLMNTTFGSALRDKAMIIESLVVMGEKDKAASLVMEVSKELSSNRWCSTQSTAYALVAISKFAGNDGLTGNELFFDYAIQDNEKGSKRTQLPLSQFNIKMEGTKPGKVNVKNNGNSIIYSRLMLEGTPLTGEEISENSKLKIKVAYKTLDGKSLDPKKIEQGTDFLGEVEVVNPGIYGNYSNMALAQIFPSGWEIINTRLAGYSTVYEKDRPDYRDIRDDRVYTHFSVRNSVKYVVLLNAAYRGKFYLPAVSCEAMYDNTIYARQAGMWVEVVQPGE